MRALLDINILIALLDLDHVHHRRARMWFEARTAQGWASCPLTQNGCVRIMSQSGYPNPVPIAEVMLRLKQAARAPEHEFWPDDISLLDEKVADRNRIHGARQITDLYLLALSVKHGGCFATFDDRIPLSAVHGARQAHLLIV
jgi:toxin-antitoxin system PIN domain toxin